MNSTFKTTTTDEVLAMLQKGPVTIIDVREDFEFASGHIPGAKNIPLGEIEERLDELNRDEEIIVVCRSGGRSAAACGFMHQEGLHVINMQGGMLDWSGEVQYEDE